MIVFKSDTSVDQNWNEVSDLEGSDQKFWMFFKVIGLSRGPIRKWSHLRAMKRYSDLKVFFDVFWNYTSNILKACHPSILKDKVFFWVHTFLGKSLTDFVSPDSKLHNQYYKKHILPAPGATGPSVITMIITFKLFAANIFLNFSLPYCKMPLRGISMPSYPKSANAGIAVSRLLCGDFKKTNK